MTQYIPFKKEKKEATRHSIRAETSARASVGVSVSVSPAEWAVPQLSVKQRSDCCRAGPRGGPQGQNRAGRQAGGSNHCAGRARAGVGGRGGGRSLTSCSLTWPRDVIHDALSSSFLKYVLSFVHCYYGHRVTKAWPSPASPRLAPPRHCSSRARIQCPRRTWAPRARHALGLRTAKHKTAVLNTRCIHTHLTNASRG